MLIGTENVENFSHTSQKTNKTEKKIPILKIEKHSNDVTFQQSEAIKASRELPPAQLYVNPTLFQWGSLVIELL